LRAGPCLPSATAARKSPAASNDAAEIRARRRCDNALSIAWFDQLVAVLFSHRAEKMLGMLIEILGFDGVTVHERSAS